MTPFSGSFVSDLALPFCEPGGVFRCNCTAEQLVSQCRDIGFVNQAGIGEPAVGDGCRSEGREHRTDVDGHIKQAERRVAFGRILRVIIQIADHHLKVPLEQAGSQRDEQQCADHQRDAETVGGRRNGQQDVSQEHHADASHHAAAIADAVGEPSTYYGQEINDCQENGIKLAGCRLLPAEFGLEKQHEDGQHRIVAETLARIGQGQRIKTFRLPFEHSVPRLAAGRMPLIGESGRRNQ